LHGDRFAALGFNIRNDAISPFLARGIVDDDGRAFRRETLDDSRANAFLRAGHYRCFTRQSAHDFPPFEIHNSSMFL
jgi:hypothetical protein